MNKRCFAVSVIILALLLCAASFSLADPVPISALKLNEEIVSVPLKKNVNLKVEIEPKNATNKKLIWESSDESVAIVKNGRITGISVGTAVVTVKTEDENGPCASVQVNVIVPVRQIKTDKAKLTLQPNVPWKQDIIVFPEDATDKTIEWTSSDETVATVDQDGVILPLKPGKCEIVGIANSSPNCKIKVNVIIKEHDVIIDKPYETHVKFITNPPEYNLVEYSPKGTKTYKIKSKFKTANGCVVSEKDHCLIPVKPGSDTITVTISNMMKEVHTVFVAQSAFEEVGLIKINPEELDANNSKIKFMDIPWGISYTDLLNGNYVNKNKTSIRNSSGAGFEAYIEGDKVAGHRVSHISCYFSYVYDEQENLCQLDDKSIFYSGEYGFYNDDRKEVFRDIYRKLSKLYGKPEELDEGFNSYAWKDNGVSLKLLRDTRTNATKLFYQWDEGAEIHDRVVLIAKKINDKEKQKKNEVVFSDSTDGL